MKKERKLSATAPKILLLLFAVFLITGMFSAAHAETLSDYAIMNVTEPENFETTEQPLGTDTNTPVLLMHQNELLQFYSWNNNKDDGTSQLNIYNEIKNKTGNIFSGLETTYSGNLKSSQNGIYGLNNVQAVAFDPNGTCRDDHVAFIGIGEDKKVYLIVFDAVNQHWSSKSELGSLSTFLTNGTDGYRRNVHLSITAGDYNGDRKDTLVVFAAVDGSSCTYLQEFAVQSGTASVLITGKYATSNMIHPDYASANVDGKYLYEQTDNSGRDRLCGQVATGDFNGDGIEDLAVMSWVNKCKNCEDDQLSISLFCPYLTFAYGQNSTTYILQNTSYKTCAISKSKNTDSDGNQYTYGIYGPGMTVGSFSAGANDSILIGGRSIIFKDNKGSGNCDDFDYSEEDYLNFSRITATGDGSLSQSFYIGSTYSLKANSLTKRTAKTDKDAYASCSLAAVAFDGPGSAEYLVMDGAVYSLETGYPTLKKNFANSGYWGDYGDSTYVSSVAVGNFNADTSGYESIIFTLSEKNASSQDDYDCRTVQIYTSSRDTASKASVGFECTTVNSKEVDDKGDNLNEGYNDIVVALDNDDDGVMLKYQEKYCYYTDPAMLAVLQAAPYFDDLYKDDVANLQNAGETTLTLAESHGKGTGAENNQDLQCGLSGKLGALFLDAALQADYSSEWSSGWEDEISYEVSEYFLATSTDTVIVYRTPVFFYSYAVYDSASGTFLYDDAHKVSFYVEQKPTYIQMSLADYNAFVACYNKTMEDANNQRAEGEKIDYTPLTALDASGILGNEGHPEYYTTQGSIFGTTKSISATGGRSGSEFTLTSEHTEYTTSSNGFSFEFEVVGGPPGAKIGANAKFEANWEESSSVISGTEVNFRGEVGNLSSSAFEQFGYDEKTYNAYGFDWQSALYDSGIKGKTICIGERTMDTVPIIGYYVTHVRSLCSAPEIKGCASGSDADYRTYLELSWEPSEGGTYPVKNYIIYWYTGGKYQKIAEVDANTTSYRYYDMKEGVTDYIFVVQPVDTQGNIGMRSEMAYGYTDGGSTIVAADYQGIFYITYGGQERTLYQYELTQNNGTKPTVSYMAPNTSGTFGNKVDTSRPTYDFMKSNDLVGGLEYDPWTKSISRIETLNGHLLTGEYVYSKEIDSCSEVSVEYCVLCGVPVTTRKEIHAHNFEETVVAGTCEEQGYTLYKCNCGVTKKANFTNKAHDFQTVTVEPTCSTKGYTVKVCSKCGEYHVDESSYTDVDEDAHDWEDYGTVTYLENGTHHQTERKICKNCGAVSNTNVTQEDHNMVSGLFENTDETYTWGNWCANCSNQVGVYHYSSVIGESFEADTTITWDEVRSYAEKLAKAKGAWYYANMPDKIVSISSVTYIYNENTVSVKFNFSLNNGKTGTGNIRRTLNGSSYGAAIQISSTSQYWGCSWDEPWCYAVLANMICQSNEHHYASIWTDANTHTTYSRCDICGHCEVVTGEHNWQQCVVQTLGEESCAVDLKYCSCGAVERTAHSESVTCNHEDHICELICQSTCSNTGHTLAFCTSCGESWIVEGSETPIDANAHQYESTEVEPTCTEDGYTLKLCTKCGHTETVPTGEKATGHTEDETKSVIIEPTCTTEGYTTHVCKTCGQTYTDTTTDPIGHQYDSANKVVVKPTCTNTGYTVNYCTCCHEASEVTAETPIDSANHHYESHYYPTTCTDQGYMEYVCSDCGNSYTELIGEEPEGHVEDPDVPAQVIAPTESEEGYTLRHCQICGEDYQTDFVPATGSSGTRAILCGHGTPTADQGNVGDYWYDLDTLDVYRKNSSGWVYIYNKNDYELNGVNREINCVTEHPWKHNISRNISDEDSAIITERLNQLEMTGLEDSVRTEVVKNVVVAMFATELAEEKITKEDLEIFLRNPNNQIEVTLYVAVNVKSAVLSGTDTPTITFGFDISADVDVYSSTKDKWYEFDYTVTKDDFAVDSAIKVILPLCGNYDIDQIVHSSSDGKEIYNVFDNSGSEKTFEVNTKKQTVTVTVSHFSDLTIKGKTALQDDNAATGITGSNYTLPIIIGLVVLAVGLIVGFIVVKKRKK